jgi:hypothetical protein
MRGAGREKEHAMDHNWTVLELMAREAERTSREGRLHLQPVARREGGGVRRSLAQTLVRLGLRLDPAAGEGLGAGRLRPAANGADR